MPDDILINPFVALMDDEGTVIDTISGVDGVRLSTSGKFRSPDNTVDLGDATNPVRTDTTGTTTQPISVAALPLPAGAATEATLAGLEAKDFATETTLAGIDFATETTLSGMNVTLTALEDRGQENMVGSLPVTIASDQSDIDTVLYDASGNPVAVVLDNSVYRLETRTTIMGQETVSGVDQKVTTITDTQDSLEVRLQTEARLAPGSTVSIGTSIPSDPAALEVGFVTNGGSENMLIDGSITPVDFTFTPPAGITLAVQSLLVVFTADDFSFDGASFGPNALLANGIEVKVDIGGVVTTIFTIKQNEDFLRVPGRIPLVNNTGPKDVLGVAFEFGGLVKLIADDGDQMIITINDNLTSIKLKYLTATIYGVEV